MNSSPQKLVWLLAFAMLASVVSFGSVLASSEPAAAQQDQSERSDWLGDANCSGTTNVIDALMIALYTVGLVEGANQCPADPTTHIDLTEADIDNDGAVTIIDALLIARCDAGIDTTPCERPAVATTATNDEMINATEIFPDEAGYAIPEVDQQVEATIAADENDSNCISDRFGPASVWYKFTATESRVSFWPTNDEQYVGIFRANEGVASPSQMADLSLISCDDASRDVGAIVRPGETYWVSVSGSWRQAMYVFDRDPGCPSVFDGACNTRSSNDRIQQAIGIDVPGPGVFVEVDDFGPGFSVGGESSVSIDWTYESDELAAGGLQCNGLAIGDWVDGNPTTGSVWYEVVAPGESLEIRGSDDQYVAFYEPIAPHGPADRSGVNGLSDLNKLACGEPQHGQAIDTIAGQTYFVVAFEQYPGQPFTIGQPLD